MTDSYPLWLAIFAAAPVAVLVLTEFKFLRRFGRIFGLSVIGSLIFAVPWDYLAITKRIWYFQRPQIFGRWLLGLPIEEWCFIVLMTTLFVIITLLVWRKYGVDLSAR